jgi:hypothetical protein
MHFDVVRAHEDELGPVKMRIDQEEQRCLLLAKAGKLSPRNSQERELKAILDDDMRASS